MERLLGAINPSLTVADVQAERAPVALGLDREHRAHRAELASPSLGRDRRVAGAARAAGGRESASPSATRDPAADCAASPRLKSWERRFLSAVARSLDRGARSDR